MVVSPHEKSGKCKKNYGNTLFSIVIVAYRTIYRGLENLVPVPYNYAKLLYNYLGKQMKF